MRLVELTVEAIERHLRYSNGEFVLADVETQPVDTVNNSISPTELLIPLINSIDDYSPLGVEPTPRNLGSLIEILRGCKFCRTENGKIDIFPDRNRARLLGAFDTPEAIVEYITETTVKPLLLQNTGIRVIDPACGAGYFVIKAADVLIWRQSEADMVDFLTQSLLGIDFDPVAIELSRHNFYRHMKNIYTLEFPSTNLDRIFRHADALDDFSNLPVKPGTADVVIGNPPYQFFSGKGSPVARLKHEGKIREADDLRKEIEGLSARFPDTSRGCKDRYKWFINRAVEFLGESGRLGFITPNTWIAYPRYKDIRKLLSHNGKFEAVIDFGSLAFKRAHVPASVIIWQKGDNNGSFPLARLKNQDWESAIAGDHNSIPRTAKYASRHTVRDGEIVEETGASTNSKSDKLVDFLLTALPDVHRSSLGQIATIREGSHAIPVLDENTSRTKSDKTDYPVLIDKTMGSLVPPERGYIEAPSRLSKAIGIYSGQRFLMRKTGDRLTVAPSPTGDFAVAHQNVYVGKITRDSIPFLTLVGILSSSLMTDLYRAGPGGQHHRPHAQLRITFLNKLPIIVDPGLTQTSAIPTEEEISAAIASALDGREYSDGPVPWVFPLDLTESIEIARRISTLHLASECVTGEIIRTGDEKYRRALDILVYQLYGGSIDK